MDEMYALLVPHRSRGGDAAGSRVAARTILLLLALGLALAVPATATAKQQATVIAFNYKPGQPTLDVVVAIPNHIDRAARNGCSDWALRVTVTYVSINGTIETLDSGPLPVKDTTSVGSAGGHSVAVMVSLPFGGIAPPGGIPSYSATVQLLRFAGGDEVCGDED